MSWLTYVEATLIARIILFNDGGHTRHAERKLARMVTRDEEAGAEHNIEFRPAGRSTN